MGTHKAWTRTGVILPCFIRPVKSSDDAVMLQPTVKSMFNVYFGEDPHLVGDKNRLSVILPADMARFMLRVEGIPVNKNSKGWMYVVLCEYLSQDQQESPALMAARKAAKGAKNVKAAKAAKGARRGKN